jgi:hypothetical protein
MKLLRVHKFKFYSLTIFGPPFFPINLLVLYYKVTLGSFGLTIKPIKQNFKN